MLNKIFVVLSMLLFIFFFVRPAYAAPNEALFYFSPGRGTHNISDTFAVKLYVDSSSNITSLKAYITYTPSMLSVENIDTTGAFNYWFENSFDKTSGLIKLQAGAPSPGFVGTGVNAGIVATITFKALSVGSPQLNYNSSSVVLLSTDQNILKLPLSTKAAYTINKSVSASKSTSLSSIPVSTPKPTLIPSRPDCNKDGKINDLDFDLLFSNWRKTNAVCDFNKDKVTNIFDLSILFSKWEK